MNRPETIAVLTYLLEAFPYATTENPDARITVWANVFSNDDPARVGRAVERWVREESRFPAPADIRGTMRAIDEPARMAVPGRTERTVPFPEGIQVAYQAYCYERQRQGRPALSYEEFRGSAFMKRLADAEEVRRRQEFRP